MEKNRLDAYLQSSGICKSRNIAQNLIKSGKVLVNNITCKKPSQLINETDIISLIENEKYVSRGAYKLLAAIDNFNIQIQNKICLDIGSSTGGFTQVLLENNANKIFALDVGTNQLDQKLRNQKNIIVLEKTNFKDVNNQTFNNEKIDLITCDVSFISARKILNKLNTLMWKNFELILLFKPQYEVGKKEISKHQGLVKDDLLKEKTLKNFNEYAKSLNFKIIKIIASPIKGAKLKNEEFLIYLRK